ncbi:MAG: glycerol-3-phosphate acyltransferase [Bacillus sp. (in: firmicutes)]
MTILFYLAFAYLIGTIMSGYLFSRFLYKENLATRGSGNLGARNAGRLYGKGMFVLTFLADALKGALAVYAGGLLHFSIPWQMLGLAMAVLGHMKPFFLKWKGGKGVSTFIGGILAVDPWAAVVIIAGFFTIYLFRRSFTIAGLASFFGIPVFLYYRTGDIIGSGLCLLIVLSVALAHRKTKLERVTPHVN